MVPYCYFSITHLLQYHYFHLNVFRNWTINRFSTTAFAKRNSIPKKYPLSLYIWKEKIPSRIDFLRNDFGNCCARCRLAAFINSCYSSSKSNFHTLSDMMNLHFSKMRAMDCRIVFIWCLTLRKNEKIHRHFSVIAKKCYFLILFRYVTISTKRYHLDTNLYMTWLNLYQEVIIDPFLVENILPCLHYLLAIRFVDWAQFCRKC